MYSPSYPVPEHLSSPPNPYIHVSVHPFTPPNAPPLSGSPGSWHLPCREVSQGGAGTTQTHEGAAQLKVFIQCSQASQHAWSTGWAELGEGRAGQRVERGGRTQWHSASFSYCNFRGDRVMKSSFPVGDWSGVTWEVLCSPTLQRYLPLGVVVLVPIEVSAGPTQHPSVVSADHHSQKPVGPKLHLDPCLLLD